MFLVRLILKSCIQMSFQGSYIIYLCFGTSNIKFWGFRMKKNELELRTSRTPRTCTSPEFCSTGARAATINRTSTQSRIFPNLSHGSCGQPWVVHCLVLRSCGQTSAHMWPVRAFFCFESFRFFWPTRLPQACLRPKIKLNTYRNWLKIRLIREERLE